MKLLVCSGLGGEVSGKGLEDEVGGSGLGGEVVGSGLWGEAGGVGFGGEVVGSGLGGEVAGSGLWGEVVGSGLGGEIAGSGFRGEIGGSGLGSEAIGGSGLGGDVGSGFEINLSGGFAESCLDTFDCKLYFNLLKLLIILYIFKANLAFPGSNRWIWSSQYNDLPSILSCRIQSSPWPINNIFFSFLQKLLR